MSLVYYYILGVHQLIDWSTLVYSLMLKHKIDEYNAKISGELPTFIVNWLCYKPILKTENG